MDSSRDQINLASPSLLSKLKRAILPENELAQTIVIAVTGAFMSLAAYQAYQKLSKKKVSETKGKNTIYTAINEFVEGEIERLRDPLLTSEDALERRDFFDLIFIVKLKSTAQFHQEVSPNQKRRA